MNVLNLYNCGSHGSKLPERQFSPPDFSLPPMTANVLQLLLTKHLTCHFLSSFRWFWTQVTLVNEHMGMSGLVRSWYDLM